MSRFNRKRGEIEEEVEDFGPTKTETKKAMDRLQALGERLAGLSSNQLKKLPITERLQVALEELNRLKAFEAIRRQKQFIGKLMRDEDEEAILNALNPMQSPTLVRQIELLADRLLAQGDTMLGEVLHRFPAAERHTLRQHMRAAQKEVQDLLDKGQDPAEAELPARKKLSLYLREVAALS